MKYNAIQNNIGGFYKETQVIFTLQSSKRRFLIRL
jgi:hypothetical protein